jgi:DNA repair exonuclease SbcCD ATPase subunit
MTGLFHIRRIRLVNFHNFVDETLPVRNNLFLIGDNQSGKTTVLDAVHFALSAGVEMEYNAAARFGPRAEAGRSLASIVLRYDLERDVPLRGPSIAYVAVEVREGDGYAFHTFGAGAYATALDSQPEVWGFIARGKSLEEAGITVEEQDARGGLRSRPRGRQELEGVLGRDRVFEKGRYRSALARFLYRDRDCYHRALDLIASAKAYRELVARAKNLDDLFIGLLPPPAGSEFQEIRDALRAIDGIQASLEDLDAELAALQKVMEKLSEARRETEKIARYEYVGAELDRRQADRLCRSAREALAEAGRAESAAGEEHEEAARRVAFLENTLKGLRASDGFSLLAREAEYRDDLEKARRERDRAEGDLKEVEEERAAAAEAAGAAVRELEGAKSAALRSLRGIAESVEVHGGREAAFALGRLTEEIEALGPDRAPPPAQLQAPFETIRSVLASAEEKARAAAARAEQEAERLRAASERASAEADALRKRAELLPDLPGFGELLDRLSESAPGAAPLYRFLGLSPETPEGLGAAIECFLGPRILGAIAAPRSLQAPAREAVLRHGRGIEVLDADSLSPEDAGDVPPGSLPAALSFTGEEDLAAQARAFLVRVAGDARILEAGEERGTFERILWTDGSMYECGAESRIDPGPPRFLGEKARREAARSEEALLRTASEGHAARAAESEGEARRLRAVSSECARCRGELRSCDPERLLPRRLLAEKGSAQAAAAATARDRARERAKAAAESFRRIHGKHEEVAALIARERLEELRDRIDRLDRELAEARAAQEDARVELQRCRDAVKRNGEEVAERRDACERAEAEASRRKDELLPLVEPAHRADLEEYVFRTMRGSRILAENVCDRVQEATSARDRAFERIQSSDGIRNERLWQRYGFRLLEESREIRDQAGRPVEEVYAEREEQVRSLQDALDEKTRDLLERVVMAGLVRRLQGQVADLTETIGGINRLAADLRFGTNRFRFSLKRRPEYQRLLSLLHEQSILQPAVREELRDFFQARLDEFKQAREGDIPEVLDYRRWFEYVLQVASREDGSAAELPRHRLRFGSGGEQAVPTYLLVLAVASLLYNRTEARLRLLLLDEAFLGIDAGRREVLLQFADRAGVDLIVATPELDGVSPALRASSTLFIEKTPEQDVYVSDYHWQRPDAQAGLFDREPGLKEEDLTLGVAREGPPAGPDAPVEEGEQEGAQEGAPGREIDPGTADP